MTKYAIIVDDSHFETEIDGWRCKIVKRYVTVTRKMFHRQTVTEVSRCLSCGRPISGVWFDRNKKWATCKNF